MVAAAPPPSTDKRPIYLHWDYYDDADTLEPVRMVMPAHEGDTGTWINITRFEASYGTPAFG